MFAGVIWYLIGWKHLGDSGMVPAPVTETDTHQSRRRILTIGLVVVLGLIALIAALAGTGAIVLTPEKVSKTFGAILAFTPLVLFPALYFFGGYDRQEKKQLLVIMVLFFGAAVFWSVFEQAASTLNLFASRNTDLTITRGFAIALGLTLVIPAVLAIRWYRSLPDKGVLALLFAGMVTVLSAGAVYYLFSHQGEAFEASYFQSANALYIVVLAPLFATLWVTLGDREPSSPAKFAVGLLFVALGFAILIIAAKLSANGVKVSPLWLVGTYFLHTIGELCLSPVGLSAMTRLAPQRIVGLVLGIWFLATSLGNYMAGFAASLYETMPLSTLFAVVTGIALVATVVLAALIGPIRRMLARE
jgi:POT family proton-dependent oligopeptide transporter